MRLYLTKNKRLKLTFDREVFIEGIETAQNPWYDKSDIQLLDGAEFKVNERVAKDIALLVNDYLEKLSNELITDENSVAVNRIIEERKRQLETEQEAKKRSYDTGEALSRALRGGVE